MLFWRSSIVQLMVFLRIFFYFFCRKRKLDKSSQTARKNAFSLLRFSLVSLTWRQDSHKYTRPMPLTTYCPKIRDIKGFNYPPLRRAKILRWHAILRMDLWRVKAFRCKHSTYLTRHSLAQEPSILTRTVEYLWNGSEMAALSVQVKTNLVSLMP